MPAAPARRPSVLHRSRGLPAPARHGGAAGLVAALAALPLLGLPVVPQGQPFLLVLGILGAALFFGRASAFAAALAATVFGVGLLLPSVGAGAADAVRGGLSLVAFLMVAFGLASAVEAMRGIFALMEVADGRRAGGAPVPVVATPPGALRLLAMSPAERRRRFER